MDDTLRHNSNSYVLRVAKRCEEVTSAMETFADLIVDRQFPRLEIRLQIETVDGAARVAVLPIQLRRSAVSRGEAKQHSHRVQSTVFMNMEFDFF
jgi:hypothetical protein